MYVESRQSKKETERSIKEGMCKESAASANCEDGDKPVYSGTHTCMALFTLQGSLCFKWELKKLS